MRHAKVSLFSLLCLCLIALVAGCGSTTSSGGGSTDGTFTLGAVPAVMIAQGSTQTITVTPSSANNFTGSVQISVSGLPSGVTVSPATATVTVGSSTTFTLTAAADAAVGTTNVKVYGASGTLSTSTTVALTVTASGGSTDGTFTLSAAAAVTIAQGSTQTITVTPSSANNFTGSVQISMSGLPSGVTVSPATATVAVGSSTTFTLTASADAAVGTTNVKVYGTSGTLSASTSVELTVTASGPAPPPTNADFTLKATPSTLALAPGASGQVTLSSTAIDGFSGTIAVAVDGLPTGVTVSPSTLSMTPNNPLVVTLTAAIDASATATPVQVRFIGTSGTLSHTATVQLTITVVGPTGPDFSITATPNTMTVAQGGQSDLVQIGVTGTNGFSGDVMYTVSGLPTGVSVIPSSSTLEDGWMEPIVFQATADAAIGNATVTITGTSGVLTHTATVALTVTAPLPADFVALALSPTSETITVGSIGTVSVTATATDGFTGTVNVSAESLPAGVTVSPVTAALTPRVPQTFTLIATGNAKPGTYTVTFLGQVNSVNGSADLALTVVNPANAGLDVPTWHYDLGRTGLYAKETSLKPASVTSAKFGKQNVLATDGAVDAQPLYVSGLTIASQSHNVLYVATENDTLYALDANSGAQLWKTSALESGETAAGNQGCNELSSQVGITSTPVIDRYLAPDGAIYFVAKTKDSGGNYHQRLHALDLTTGAELSGSPMEIAATSPGTGGANTFDPSILVERSALLLSNGTVYLSWAAPCHQTSFDYESWVMAYSEGTLQQMSVLDLTPNGSGGGVWMSGAGPAADADGNVFLATSKGTFDTTLDGNGYPVNGDYGNGYVKIQALNGVMSVFDYFEPLNGVQASATNYQDQGSGGVLLVPDLNLGGTILSLAAGAGKDGNIYVMGRTGDFLGEYDGQNDNNLFTMSNALPNGASSTPAYFNNMLYYGGIGDSVKSINVLDPSGTPVTQSSTTLGSAGATPVISANGTSAAILWALDATAAGGPVLHAYDATNLSTELYNSSMQAARDTVDATGNYTVPMVVSGHVYVGTQTGVDVFGPLP
jgi:hypothetical protein